MIGQWVGRVEGEIPGTLRIETEDRGFGLIGRTYLFYDDPNLPGYLFDINLPKGQPLQAKLATIYLYPAGGIMSAQDRQGAEAYLVSNYGGAMPSHLDVEFSIVGLDLIVAWAQPEPVSADKPSGVKRFLRLVQKQGDDDGPQRGNVTLRMSDPAGASVLTPRPDLVSWDQFRHWAAGQHPRHYIFRGQRQPFKLATTFHRTWRKNLNQWITQDIELLFGSVAETLKYPLQLGNLQHNAAIWSILQHHGYPTPMLDWSYSPFVAAYFAFQQEIEIQVPPRIYIFDRVAWINKYGKAGFIVDAASKTARRRRDDASRQPATLAATGNIDRHEYRRRRSLHSRTRRS